MKRCANYRSMATRFALGLGLPAAFFLGFGTLASAQSGTQYYDLFQTGSGASVDLSNMGFGTVQLQGVPIQGSTGNTDTIMQRTTTSDPNTDSVVVYALQMQSTSPVTYKGQSADVYITVNNTAGTPGAISESVLPQPDNITQPTGGTVVRTPSAGTFNSNVTVNADVILVTHGGQVTNSANILGSQPAPSITLTSSNSPYSSSASSGYPSNSNYPSGGFYGQPHHQGPHPVIPSKCSSGTTASSTRVTGPSPAKAVQACITTANPVVQNTY